MSETQWDDVADEILAQVQKKLEVTARKAAEDFYAEVLGSAEQYLSENARFNIAGKLSAADRQVRSALRDNDMLTAKNKSLRSALSLLSRAAENARGEDFNLTTEEWAEYHRYMAAGAA